MIRKCVSHGKLKNYIHKKKSLYNIRYILGPPYNIYIHCPYINPLFI